MTHLKIDYVEFATERLGETRAFFEKAFGWAFQDYGPDYAAMTNAGIDGGIHNESTAAETPPLVILKADDLEAALRAVTTAGAEIVKPIFPFPGGRRFHFREPGGNEMAVWSET
jgi:predicted enzyme related to lactoylglutathione lyase